MIFMRLAVAFFLKFSPSIFMKPHSPRASFFTVPLLICPLLHKGYPGSSDDKESTCNVGDLGAIPGLGRSSEEGKDYPL